MTMWKHDSSNIWYNVLEDLDIDDMIFGEDSRMEQKKEHVCSDR